MARRGFLVVVVNYGPFFGGVVVRVLSRSFTEVVRILGNFGWEGGLRAHLVYVGRTGFFRRSDWFGRVEGTFYI